MELVGAHDGWCTESEDEDELDDSEGDDSLEVNIIESGDCSDKDQQVCPCGWTKWTTKRGLRIHQGKKGCTPRGMRNEDSQQRDMLGKSGLKTNQKDVNRGVHNLTMTETGDCSDKDQQVCPCGWTKWTTYHGLRIHQGRKGCTPRGMGNEESQQQDMLGKSGLKTNQKDSRRDVDNSTEDNKSQQVCPCGWSKLTTYQGLRTHQVKKGCTPGGIEREDEDELDDSEGDDSLEVNTIESGDCSDKDQQVCPCGWTKWTTKRGLRIHQGKKGCTPRGMRNEESQQRDMLGKSGLKTNQKDSRRDVDNSIEDNESQQVCPCGWSKWTTNRGLRIHQGKKGCTPGGIESEDEDELDDNEGDDLLEVNTIESGDCSDKDQQVCPCGWTKWTTYHGLRIHQGKKGCTPRGMRNEESQQQDMLGKSGLKTNQKDYRRDVDNSIEDNESQQVCPCGWSKWTTYHGLRTHQGIKGCTPRGMGNKEIQQRDMLGKSGLKTNQKDVNRGVHNLTMPETGDCSDKDQQVCFCGWTKWTTYRGLRTHQGRNGCTPKGLSIPLSDQHFWKTQWEANHPKRVTFRKEL